ncbi:hypothetical protein LCGC14_1329080, partial [marine sediment metagenome]
FVAIADGLMATIQLALAGKWHGLVDGA